MHVKKKNAKTELLATILTLSPGITTDDENENCVLKPLTDDTLTRTELYYISNYHIRHFYRASCSHCSSCFVRLKNQIRHNKVH